MKNILSVILLMTIPFLGTGQQKAATKSTAPKATTPAAQPAAKSTPPKANTTAVSAEPANSGSLCRINGEGLRLTLSGKDFDAEGITDKNGSFVFQNVPAGDKVITKAGEQPMSPSCKFVITCQGAAGKTFTKTGTFGQLSQGVSFRMVQAGTVSFGIK